MEVKPKLSEILKERNMTQRELSDLTGIPQGSISRFDKNDRVVVRHLFLIARALDISVEDLFIVRE